MAFVDMDIAKKMLLIAFSGTAILVGHVFLINLIIQAPTRFENTGRPFWRLSTFIMAYMEEVIFRYLPLRLTADAFHNNWLVLAWVAVLSSMVFGWLHSRVIYITFNSIRLIPLGHSPLVKYLMFQGGRTDFLWYSSLRSLSDPSDMAARIVGGCLCAHLC